jgi:dolichyl-phosphate beta-glucosyltransferase
MNAVIVVPCYNEARRLPRDQYLDFLEAHDGFTLLFVNDGSRDETLDVLRGLQAERPARVEVLDLERNGGKAEAVRRGVVHVGHDAPLIGFLDADLSTPLEALIDFREVFVSRPEVELVLGARVRLLGRNIERRQLRHLLGRAFATAASATLSLPVYDTQCGAKMWRPTAVLQDVFATPFSSRWVFDVELLARYAQAFGWDTGALSARIVELPLTQWREVSGSRLKPTDFLQSAADLVSIAWKYRVGN